MFSVSGAAGVQPGAAPAMAQRQITIWAYTCERCGHDSVPREITQAPRVCPKCKSPYWDRPRQRPTPAKRPKARNKARR